MVSITGETDQHGWERTAPSGNGFRPDIQGLRGIAVLLVVAFHSGGLVPGGYVGVDVFFVISGFIIARMLLVELDDRGTIDLRRFYARRVKRLFPAIAAVTIATLVGTVFFLSPLGGQQWAAMTAAAATVFGANVYLAASGGGYFSPGDETNPFLHFWSLAVEEQFYLFFPAFMIACWKLGGMTRRVSRRAVVGFGLVGMSSLSLLLSWWWSNGVPVLGVRAPERLAFYGSPTRAWEFAVGIGLAVAANSLRKVTPTTGHVLGVSGFILLGWSAWQFDAATTFPGTAAAIPVLGSAALVVAGSSSSATRRLLAARPLTWIGDISFGWYLWHWPAIVFAAVVWPDQPMALAAAATVALVPAVASYRLLENPIRSSLHIRGARVLGVAACCTLLPLGAALAVDRGANARWGLDIPETFGTDRSLALELGCHRGLGEFPADQCIVATEGSRGTILLLGDSHARAFSDTMAAAGATLGHDVAIWTRASCPVGLGPMPAQPEGCERWREALTTVLDTIQPDHVVIVHRPPMYLDERTSRARGLTLAERWDRRGLDEDDAAQLWTDSVGRFFAHLDAIEVSSTKVAVVPYHEDFPDAVGLRAPVPPELSLDELNHQRERTLAISRSILDPYPTASIFDPAVALCQPTCRSTDADGTWLYYDGDHITPEAAPIIAPSLVEHLEPLLAGPTAGSDAESADG